MSLLLSLLGVTENSIQTELDTVSNSWCPLHCYTLSVFLLWCVPSDSIWSGCNLLNTVTSFMCSFIFIQMHLLYAVTPCIFVSYHTNTQSVLQFSSFFYSLQWYITLTHATGFGNIYEVILFFCDNVALIITCTVLHLWL